MALVRLDKLTPERMSDEAAMRQWAQSLVDLLRQSPDANPKVEVALDSETNAYVPKITLLLKGVAREIALPLTFLSGREYKGIATMIDRVQDLLEPGAYVQRGERRLVVEHFADGFDWLKKEARGGIDLQRYMGLGEMNPEQLWETTLDPNNRSLLQVKIDDQVGSQQIFENLMGDDVAPRRKFIEEGAASVVNLDI